MQFCPNCNNRLEETRDNEQQTVLKCRDCGFSQTPEKQKENIEKGQKEKANKHQLQSSPLQEIKVIDSNIDKNVSKSTIEIVCPHCGHDKATWSMVQTDRADEPSTQFFQCAKCEHTWREE